ncbi:39S ribosomal protein L15, mitochondrial [Condylostylus longicornis]|uniref:39S ribosomal protein L15, mitochondrial n=1 Tax=Condylostylus longicornis TaxID=2530218 RepID=UPI00244DDFD5|nr:39S ribosomal protein L15, mitochondrial [Condylostylus longicornis]
MGSAKEIAEKSIKMLQSLPRIQLGNLRPNPNSKLNVKRGRAQHGGDKHGAGNKGSGQRQNYMRLGYETGNTPFYLRFPYEPYYKGHHLRREYPPLSLHQLQTLLDTDRIDKNKPIDLTQLCNTGVVNIDPVGGMHYGFQLTDEGINNFKAKIVIEVQHAKENVIAAVERNGGVIRTAYYDVRALQILVDPEKWFEKGIPIPKRMLPPQDAIDYYTSAVNRGYLANQAEIDKEREKLATKYGYTLSKLNEDPGFAEIANMVKEEEEIFYGLKPGWVINLVDKEIIKPKATNV